MADQRCQPPPGPRESGGRRARDRQALSRGRFRDGSSTPGASPTTRRPAPEALDEVLPIRSACLPRQPADQPTDAASDVRANGRSIPIHRAALHRNWAAFVTLAWRAAANVGVSRKLCRPARLVGGRNGAAHYTSRSSTKTYCAIALSRPADPEEACAARRRQRRRLCRRNNLELDARADAIPEPTDLPPGPSPTTLASQPWTGWTWTTTATCHHPRWLDRRR